MCRRYARCLSQNMLIYALLAIALMIVSMENNKISNHRFLVPMPNIEAFRFPADEEL